MMRRTLPLLAIFLLYAGSASAQEIRGTVTEDLTGKPVAGVMLSAVADGGLVRAVALSDSTGRFVLAISTQDTLRVRAERIGYVPFLSQPVPLPRYPLHVEIRLTPEPIELPAIAAEVRPQLQHNLEQFLQRKRTAFGRFLGPDDIAARPIRNVAHTIADMGGARVLVDGSGRGVIARVDGRICIPRVVLDGSLMPTSLFPGFGTDLPSGVPITSYITADQIRGVEVYRNPLDAPVEYQLSRMDRGVPQAELGCPIIVIWTVFGFATSR